MKTQKHVRHRQVCRDLTNKVIRSLASHAPTEIGLAFEAALESDFSKYEELNIRHYFDESVDTFSLAYQLIKLVSSYPFYDAVDKKTATIEKYLKNYRDMEELNKTLIQGLRLPFEDEIAALAAAILGRCPEPDEITSYRHGPGATLGVTSQQAPVYKCSALDIGTNARTCFSLATNYCSYIPDKLQSIETTRLAMVPKSSFINRMIEVSQTWNVWLQLGYGREIESRLRRIGIYLRPKDGFHTPTYHGRLAKRGSLDGSVTTADFASASDRISLEVVKRLLKKSDPMWLYWLTQLRSTHFELEGVRYRHQIFSGMGNGFTFPLETLLFYCIARVVTHPQEGLVSAFGDDVILPSTAFQAFVDISSAWGLKINVEKTYSSTDPFRESCGYDYFKGHRVFKNKCPEYRGGSEVGSILYITGMHNLLYRLGTEEEQCALDPRYAEAMCRARRGAERLKLQIPLTQYGYIGWHAADEYRETVYKDWIAYTPALIPSKRKQWYVDKRTGSTVANGRTLSSTSLMQHALNGGSSEGSGRAGRLELRAGLNVLR
uniref:RNA-directed RNA polymerase n=1 Tax=Cooper virus TaxID=2707208 RepID=A0A6H0DIH1_9VIRU|nr:MAG: RNA-dependent RNA polymerase [Cooper virus]